MAVIVAWVSALFAVMIGASRVTGHQLDAWRATTPTQTFWGIQGSELYDKTLIMLLVIFGLWLIVRATERPRDWGPVLVFVLVAYGLALLFVGQARYAITRTDLIVHSLLPWNPAVRVPLASTAVVSRGCTRTYRRTNTVIFRVRYGSASDDIVNLGAAVGWRNNRQWLEAMRSYDDGRSSSLPQEAREGVELDRNCLSAMSFGMNDEQRARFRRLLQ
ncbi:hypothetical protein [uncultured Enterovirga sp.]|uniref:hypothetical protein n=1 Tax=uncultured Enterovirga sp. TaxID=2026352 RepID=UPI0035CB1077